ncbi:MAG: hypothetical protein WBP72_13685, partial [Rhodocyclaceae bacterium]
MSDKPHDLTALLARAREQDQGPPSPKPPATWPLWVLSAPQLVGALISLSIGGFAGFVSGLGGGEFFSALAQKAHRGGLGDALGWGLVAVAAVLT